MVYDVNLIATLLLGWTAMCQGKMMENADEPKSVIKEYKAGSSLGNASSSSRTTDNNTCCNPKAKSLKTNLTINCSNSLGLKTSHKRYARSPIMVPVDYKNDIKTREFIDIDKEPGELQDLIGSVKPPEEFWDSQKEFKKDYNKTKQRNIEHPQGYYSTPTEKINFTGGYLVKENEDESEDVEDKIEKWRKDPVMYDMTGDGSDKDYKRDEEENNDSKSNEEENNDSGSNEEEVDLSDQFEDDKVEPPEFSDKFFKTRPYYKYLKYPRDSIAEASTENEKTPDKGDKVKGDIENVTISYKPINETRDVGFYRHAPQPYEPSPQYRPHNDGGMYIFRKRSPYERKRKVIIVSSPVPRKPRLVIRNTNCNACIIPRNVIKTVGMPMYYYPLSKVPPSRFRHVYPPTNYYNKFSNYNTQPFPGDPRFTSTAPGVLGDSRLRDFRASGIPGDSRLIPSGDFRTSGNPRGFRLTPSGDFRASGISGDSRLITSGNFKTSGIPGDQKLITSETLGDLKTRSTPNPTEPKKESPTRYQRHNTNFVPDVIDPNAKRSEIHIVRDTPGGYDDTVIYHERKYVPTDLEISASEPYRPDPFRDVEEEYSERIEQLNDLIEREGDKTSREIDREYEYWDEN